MPLVWAVPELAKVNPLTGNVLEEPGVDYAGDADGGWSHANPVWDGAGITLQALRNEWVAVQLELGAPRGQARWTLRATTFRGKDARLPADGCRMFRCWYQHCSDGPRGWYADPLLPLPAGAPLEIPAPDQALAGQHWQSVYCEWHVPAQVPAGTYRASIIANDGTGEHEVPITLAVGAPAIPDRAAFVLSLNAYDPPGEDCGPPASAGFLAAERSFHVMSHEHRATLAVVGYGHSAHFQPGIDLPLAGSGAAMHVSDWSAWDQRFGPLFDGSAFAGTARAGVAYDHFYLPFMESWPTPMRDGYQWDRLSWEDHWRLAGTPEQGFSEAYKQQWMAVMRDVDRHINTRGWSTRFLVYLNDKYYYKQYDPVRRRDGAGTSFWLLDEPMHIDDFRALGFFAGLTRSALADERGRILFRADISRPQWGRDTLDRSLDLQVSGGYDEHAAWLKDWRERYGQTIWTYGSTPPATQPASAIVAMLMDLYRRGVDGYVPWLVLGSGDNWIHPVETCVLYTGHGRGVEGACPSLRLQAYRRAEQEIEYLRLYALQQGWPAHDPDRRALEAWLAGLFGPGRMQTLDAAGGARMRQASVGLGALDALHRLLWLALTSAR